MSEVYTFCGWRFRSEGPLFFPRWEAFSQSQSTPLESTPLESTPLERADDREDPFLGAGEVFRIGKPAIEQPQVESQELLHRAWWLKGEHWLRISKWHASHQWGYYFEDQDWQIDVACRPNGDIDVISVQKRDRDSESGVPLDIELERVVLPCMRLFSSERVAAFHASALGLPSGAWLFMGGSHSGKSSTCFGLLERAAQLQSGVSQPISGPGDDQHSAKVRPAKASAPDVQGGSESVHPTESDASIGILADDFALVEVHQDAMVVCPSTVSLRLWDDLRSPDQPQDVGVAHPLGQAVRRYSDVARSIEGLDDQGREKRWYRLADRWLPRIPQPLVGLVVLSPQSEIRKLEIDRLSGYRAVEQLLANGLDLSHGSPQWKQKRTQLACRIAERVPVYHVRYPRAASGQPEHVPELWDWLSQSACHGLG